MTIPAAFEERLRSTFQGRLRIRWSVKAREWHIEQKVGRAITAPIRIEADRDDLICARDGFDYLLTVRQGDRMPCPICEWQELKVPVRDFVDIRCAYCASKGLQGRTVAGFWPLDDSLIDHLKKLDPESDYSRNLAKDIDRRNQQREASQEADLSNTVKSAGSEHFDSIVGIPHFGFSTAKQWPADLGPQSSVSPIHG